MTFEPTSFKIYTPASGIFISLTLSLLLPPPIAKGRIDRHNDIDILDDLSPKRDNSMGNMFYIQHLCKSRV